jgi:orotate phosphoribosyltransferase
MLARQIARVDSNTEKLYRLREIIRALSLLRGEKFLLASGEWSDYYFDMKPTTLDPEGASLVGDLMLNKLRGLQFDFVGGIEIGAIPVVVAVCVKSHQDFPVRGFFVRDTAKDHGTKKLIDGHIKDGATVIIVDDVTTKGDSAMKAVAAVRTRGCKVLKVISIVDRQEGATKRFAAEGIEFTSIFTTADFD